MQERMALTPVDLQAFIDQHGLQAELVNVSMPTPTVQAAANAVGVSPHEIIKSILFLIANSPVLVVASGPSLIDRRLLARHFGVGRKQVKLAQSKEVQAVSGYTIGGVPPFGHLNPIETVMDHQVLQLEQVYAGGGARDVLIRVAPEEIQRITSATLLDLISQRGDIEA
jgi:Cys-tRNA(Pro) deacylase